MDAQNQTYKPSLEEILKGVEIAYNQRTPICFLVVNGKEVTEWTKFGYTVEADDRDPGLERTYADVWYTTDSGPDQIVHLTPKDNFILRAGPLAAQAKSLLLIHNTLFFVDAENNGHTLGAISYCSVSVKRNAGMVFDIDTHYKTIAIPINEHAAHIREKFGQEMPVIVIGEAQVVKTEEPDGED